MPTLSPLTRHQGEGCLLTPEPCATQERTRALLQATSLKLSCLWRAGHPGEESGASGSWLGILWKVSDPGFGGHP